MFGFQITLFNIFGFKVKIDASWLIIATLLTWSLATGYFPAYYEGFSTATYWWMGVAGTLGLFFSIIFHELSHSLVARHHNLQIKGITLFIFGGIAEMEKEPQTAQIEFKIAIAGPLASFFLAAVFYGLFLVGQMLSLSLVLLAVLSYAALFNTVLGVFNLVPAFPLDGGRVLRAVLWFRSGDFNHATRIASRFGKAFGLFLTLMGVVNLVMGNFITGLWWILIGMFLQGAASANMIQSELRQALEGKKVKRFMNKQPISVSPELTIYDLVEDYIYKYHHKLFPVIKDSTITGFVTTRQVIKIAKNMWQTVTVEEIMSRDYQKIMIEADEDAVNALERMKQSQTGRLLVMDRGKLVGVVALKDMLELLSLKQELGEQGS